MGELIKQIIENSFDGLMDSIQEDSIFTAANQLPNYSEQPQNSFLQNHDRERHPPQQHDQNQHTHGFPHKLNDPQRPLLASQNETNQVRVHVQCDIKSSFANLTMESLNEFVQNILSENVNECQKQMLDLGKKIQPDDSSHVLNLQRKFDQQLSTINLEHCNEICYLQKQISDLKRKHIEEIANLNRAHDQLSTVKLKSNVSTRGGDINQETADSEENYHDRTDVIKELRLPHEQDINNLHYESGQIIGKLKKEFFINNLDVNYPQDDRNVSLESYTELEDNIKQFDQELNQELKNSQSNLANNEKVNTKKISGIIMTPKTPEHVASELMTSSNIQITNTNSSSNKLPHDPLNTSPYPTFTSSEHPLTSPRIDVSSRQRLARFRKKLKDLESRSLQVENHALLKIRKLEDELAQVRLEEAETKLKMEAAEKMIEIFKNQLEESSDNFRIKEGKIINEFETKKIQLCANKVDRPTETNEIELIYTTQMLKNEYEPHQNINIDQVLHEHNNSHKKQIFLNEAIKPPDITEEENMIYEKLMGEEEIVRRVNKLSKHLNEEYMRKQKNLKEEIMYYKDQRDSYRKENIDLSKKMNNQIFNNDGSVKLFTLFASINDEYFTDELNENQFTNLLNLCTFLHEFVHKLNIYINENKRHILMLRENQEDNIRRLQNQYKSLPPSRLLQNTINFQSTKLLKIKLHERKNKVKELKNRLKEFNEQQRQLKKKIIESEIKLKGYENYLEDYENKLKQRDEELTEYKTQFEKYETELVLCKNELVTNKEILKDCDQQKLLNECENFFQIKFQEYEQSFKVEFDEYINNLQQDFQKQIQEEEEKYSRIIQKMTTKATRMERKLQLLIDQKKFLTKIVYQFEATEIMTLRKLEQIMGDTNSIKFDLIDGSIYKQKSILDHSPTVRKVYNKNNKDTLNTNNNNNTLCQLDLLFNEKNIKKNTFNSFKRFFSFKAVSISLIFIYRTRNLTFSC